MTILQDHNAQVTLKMFGTLWVIDFGDCKVVGRAFPKRQMLSLHVKGCQFPVQHYRKLLPIPPCVRINRPVG